VTTLPKRKRKQRDWRWRKALTFFGAFSVVFEAVIVVFVFVFVFVVSLSRWGLRNCTLTVPHSAATLSSLSLSLLLLLLSLSLLLLLLLFLLSPLLLLLFLLLQLLLLSHHRQWVQDEETVGSHATVHLQIRRDQYSTQKQIGLPYGDC